MLYNYLNESENQDKTKITTKMCFDALSDAEKFELQNNKITLEFEAGETIIKKGFVASSIMFLEEGLAKLDISTDGHLSTIGLIPPSSFIGIICTFASRNYNFSAVAIEKTKVSLFDRQLFDKFIKQNGEFAYLFIQLMSMITNDLVHHLSRFSHKNIDGALAILLTDFCNVYQSDSFVLPVNRKEMAKMLGYSKESVINTLSKFNKEGIITVNEKQIQIVDKIRLIQIGEIG